MTHFEIDGVFYFMAAAALLLVIVAGLGVLLTPAPKHLEVPFKIMAPQAGPLAHGPLDASHKSISAQ
jgi:hypothetical protein